MPKDEQPSRRRSPVRGKPARQLSREEKRAKLAMARGALKKEDALKKEAARIKEAARKKEEDRKKEAEVRKNHEASKNDRPQREQIEYQNLLDEWEKQMDKYKMAQYNCVEVQQSTLRITMELHKVVTKKWFIPRTKQDTPSDIIKKMQDVIRCLKPMNFYKFR